MEGAAEDSVTYRLYFNEPGVDEQYLCAALSTFMHFVESTTRGYIWQSEPFELRLASFSQIPHLLGSTYFGECVADEWLITYLLFELTRHHRELAVTVEDSDGHFLLIEAAHAIPRWLNEKTATNRVFVCHGQLHIIPQPRHPGEVGIFPAGVPTVENALQLVFGDFPTAASPAVQSPIRRKLDLYPEEIQRSRHLAHCILPLPAAHVLTVKPALVAPAVQAFYQRDPMQLKACRKMRFFPPTAPSVRCAVSFSRLLYAQLRQQQFKAQASSGWRYPPVQKSGGVCAYDLGVKLSHGLEILCAQAAPDSTRPSTDNEEKACSGVRWERFLQCLKQRDYFQGELEGSQLYRKLLASAKLYFIRTFGEEEGDSAPWQKRAGSQVLEILQSASLDEEQLRKTEKNLPPADSESWMDITSEQLDELLREYSAQPENATSLSGLSGHQQVNEMVSGMHQFVHAISSHEGVEVPTRSRTEGVDFNADTFSDALASILNLTSAKQTNELDAPLSSDEFGDDDVDSVDEDSEMGSSDDSKPQSESALMKSYMDSMDSELAVTGLAKSFDRVQPESQEDHSEVNHGAEATAGLSPVDIDMNLVKNLLESYSSQQGLAGPVSSILHAMGVNIPPNDTNKDE